jgi:hypothetical protein
MRGTGKTTRLIDEAVQHLFEHGYIRIVMNSEIYREDFYRGFTSKQIEHFKKFIDPDACPDNRAQLHFVEALAARLYYEHGYVVDRISKTEFKVKQSRL